MFANRIFQEYSHIQRFAGAVCQRWSKNPVPIGALRYKYNPRKTKDDVFYEDFHSSLKRRRLLLRANIISKKSVTLHLPRFISEKPIVIPPFSWSEAAGHGSFVFLALSYLENDFLWLRMYAFSGKETICIVTVTYMFLSLVHVRIGITLSIIFQYYREIPLWIPIRWNFLFLLINGVMIALLLKEQNDANNIQVGRSPSSTQTRFPCC